MRLAKEMGHLDSKSVNWFQHWALTYSLVDEDRVSQRHRDQSRKLWMDLADQVSFFSNPAKFQEIKRATVETEEEESEFIPLEDLGQLSESLFAKLDRELGRTQTMTAQNWTEWE